MWLAAIVAQVADLPEAGGGGWFYWLIGAGVILGLWFLIARTRRKSYRAYWERRRREEEMRANDPDMARPDDSDAAE